MGHWRNVEWRLHEIIGGVTSSWAEGTILGDEHFAQLANAVVGMLWSGKFGSSAPIDLDDFKRRCGELFEELQPGLYSTLGISTATERSTSPEPTFPKWIFQSQRCR